jgi:opacity protein-like surface antigen
MAIKKYAFLSLALLTSMSKALFSNDSCFKFYVGGDLGMGIFSIDNYQGETKDPDNVTRVQPITYKNSNSVFIGGGRVGVAWTGSNCWYAAIEGNIHSVNRSSCMNGEFDEHPNTDPSSLYNPEITFIDKTRFIAGLHAHLGYKAVEDGALYAIVGYKYLRSESRTLIVDELFESINQFGCINNNGWVVGLGGLWNLECNWDVRLEALYTGFGTKCGTDNYDVILKIIPVKTVVTSDYTYRPSLLYAVVSLAYNF